MRSPSRTSVYRAWSSERKWNDGWLHRLDGPAMEFDDGTKFWYVKGKYLRSDVPSFQLPTTQSTTDEMSGITNDTTRS